VKHFATTQKRQNLAHSHATETHLERLFFSICLGAWGVPADLSDRGVRLLQALCALNRGGSVGWIGTRCTLAALGAFVRRVVGGAASVSTVQRMIADLKAAGFVSVGHYGGGAPREIWVRGGGTRWVRDQRVVLTLTDRALALWSGGPAYSSTPKSKCTRDDLSSVLSSPLRVEDLETPVQVGASVVVSAPPVALTGAVVDRPIVVDRTVEREACKPRGAVEIDRTIGEFEHLQDAESVRKVGAKSGRSVIRGTPPTTRKTAARAILAALIVALENHGRSGKRAIAVAALELADPRAESSGVPWGYWIAKWGGMSPSERRSVCRSTLFPMLCGARVPAVPAVPALALAEPLASPLPSSDVPPLAEPVDVRAILREASNENPFARAFLAEREKND
jgi:hypothetical protein